MLFWRDLFFIGRMIAGKGGRIMIWEGEKSGRVVSWEGGKGGRVVR